MTSSRPHRNGRGLFAGILLGAILGLILGGYFGNRLWPAVIGAAVLGAAMYRVNPGGK
ncbi:hypothetical protein IV500_03270 [Paeniglutamicibacter antarcticus]|uniref:Uncharacterized protein n=1 Tax=Arthrobacter terrae TaxID=2935737 RepID=A0A931G455_9MICC|nr:hypothetical protein [Arthrobacter terrae]MBG0738448.1 hypothetical protein [Arthrobacter terrae]